MAMTAGARLGPYEILGPLGVGGMGEVYRARDTRLDRVVALKTLPALFAADPERLSRFEREAKTLASLNHPHIAQIYGIERAGTAHALAMELVEGDDLSDRIGRGAIPLEDALSIARQITDALEAAHEQGIVHRDLKPANVKVRSDGVVKVLDFGLAKAMSGNVGSGSDIVNSPTLTSPAVTRAGVILGTAAYMAPEQARGRPVDRRADIWAFGGILYEMLTRRRPFAGDDVSMTLAAVLKEPVDFDALPRETPPSILRLLRRCLEKDPRKRLSSIADARLDLDEADRERGGDSTAPALAAPAPWRVRLVWAIAGASLAAILSVVVLLSRGSTAGVRVVRSEISFPSPLTIGRERSFAVNPPGTEIVFAADEKGRSRLFRRRLAESTAVAIPGADDATGPFFSPDGAWLGFTQSGRLKKMPAAGGEVIDVSDSRGGQGGAFAPDSSVIFNRAHGMGLMRAPADGSGPTVLTTPDAAKGEAGHHWPHMLPDGKHVIFTYEVDGKPYSDARIMLLSLDTGERRLLLDGGTDARFVPTGHLLYWHEGAVWSVPFDTSRLQVTGQATAVLRDVMIVEANGHALFSTAATGVLVYLSGRDPRQETAIMLVDRSGAARALTKERRAFATVGVSPDGQRIATTVVAANDSIWTMDTDRGTPSRITFQAEVSRPTWSPDGAHLALAVYTGGQPQQLFVMPSDGSTPPMPLRRSTSTAREYPESWTANGNLLAFRRAEPSVGDIWVMEMSGEHKARPVLATPFDEVQARFSPDGQWLAYASNESGRYEVYVKAFPGPGPKRTVSVDGGTDPRWRGDGREIFFRHDDAVLAANVAVAPDLRVSLPRVLFTARFVYSDGWASWDVMSDGRAFLLPQNFAQPRSTITLVQNWFEELEKAQ
jgi:serine/threonine protein kinase